MKKIKFIFFIIFPILFWGQTQPSIYDLSFIKCDSVIVYDVNLSQNVIPKDSMTFIYDNLRNNIKQIQYLNGEVYMKSIINIIDNKISIERNHYQVHKYDSIINDWPGKIYENDFSQHNYIYENQLLIRKQYYKSTKGYLSFDYESLFEYDSLNRIKKEALIDRYKGYVMHSKYNSLKMDSITQKIENVISYKTYNYNPDYILIEYFKENKIVGKEKIFGTIERPQRIIQFNENDQIQKEVVYTYNENEKIIEVNVNKDNFITPWNTETYEINLNKILIKYNDLNNPIEVQYFSNGKRISLKEFKYYAP